MRGYDTQLPLFDRPREVAPRDPKVTEEEKPRLSRQCRVILDMLKQGQRTNKELADVALKYSGRISDLRKAGCVIEPVMRDHKTGLTVYELKYVPAGL